MNKNIVSAGILAITILTYSATPVFAVVSTRSDVGAYSALSDVTAYSTLSDVTAQEPLHTVISGVGENYRPKEVEVKHVEEPKHEQVEVPKIITDPDTFKQEHPEPPKHHPVSRN